MRTLCAIFAHPDDESFSSGATLARYAEAGVQVTLVTATSGEAGEVGSAPVAPEGLAAWREGELRKAAQILGVNDLRLLRLPDGKLAGQSADLFTSVTEVLREVRPQVILTEDHQGITGHPDHIAVTESVLRAVDELGESGPLKLYEHVLPQSVARQGLYGTPEDAITTTLNVELWRVKMLAALRAHGSQVGDNFLEQFAAFPAPLLDHYVCVRARVAVLVPEDDLFSGIPE